MNASAWRITLVTCAVCAALTFTIYRLIGD